METRSVAQALRVLIVEDSQDDAELVMRALRRGGLAPVWERVESAEAMSVALATQAWDIVITDFALPGFSGSAALKILQDSGIDLPIIVVSGTIGEDAAVEMMRAGAHDYVMKDNLTRLAAAVRRELRDAGVRRRWTEAEEALRASEARARAIVNAAVDGIITIDEQSVVRSFNPAAETTFGYAADEIVGQHVRKLMPAGYAAAHDDYIGNYLRTGRRRIIGIGREVEGKRRDGSIFPLDVTVSEFWIGDRRMFAAVVRDVTGRKNAERRLATQYTVTSILASAASLPEASPKILESICEGLGWQLGELWIVDADRQLLHWQGTWRGFEIDAAQLEEISRDTTFERGAGLPGRVWASRQPDWLSDVDRTGRCFLRSSAAAAAGLRAAFAFPIQTGGTVLGVMAFFSRENREPDEDVSLMLEALGSQIGHFVERKRVEEKLVQLAAIVASSEEVIYSASLEGSILSWNGGAEKTYGYSSKEIIGQPFSILFAPDSSGQAERILDQIRRGQRIHYQEVLQLRRDDSVFPASLIVSPVKDADGGIIGASAIAHDITEQKRAETSLREVQKLAHQRERLADIGAVTAEMIHDLGNPLAGISMQAQLILRRASRDTKQPISTVMQPLERIRAEVFRLDTLVKGFMEFSRDQRLERQTLVLPRFLEDLCELWRPVAKARRISLSLKVPQDVPAIRADEEKLRRVFENLLRNAVEAIEAGPGRIRVHVSRSPAGAVRVSVEDTGPGIPDSVQVFRLFETTKRNGSGLGLAIARQFVLAHGGEISYEPLRPRGTVFHVDLPS